MHFHKKHNAKRIHAVLLIIALFSIMTITAFANFELGYDMYVDGKRMGAVKTLADGEAMVEKVNSDLSGVLGDEKDILNQAQYYLKLVSKDEVNDTESFTTQLKSTSDKLVFGYTVFVDGKKAFSCPTDLLARQVIDRYAQQFVTENTLSKTILSSIDIRADYVFAGELKGETAALDVLNQTEPPLVRVKTTENAVETLEIPFEIITEADNSAYEGSSRVTQEGAAGSRQVTKVVSKENGAIKSYYVTEEEILAQPVTQVVAAGTAPRPAGVGTGEFILPASGTISSQYGARWGRTHKGIDIAAPTGTPIYAADEGKVVYAAYHNGGFGNMVQIDHGNGFKTYYAHCSELLVSVGDTVAKGDLIAKIGSTGRSTGAHCHFEIITGGESVNPANYINY